MPAVRALHGVRRMNRPLHTTGSTPGNIPARLLGQRGLAALLAVALAGAQGCASWHPITPETEASSIRGAAVRGAVQGVPLEVEGVDLDGPFLTAKARGPHVNPAPFVIDLRGVQGPEARYRDTGEKIGLGVGIGVGSAAGAALIGLFLAGIYSVFSTGFNTGAGMR